MNSIKNSVQLIGNLGQDPEVKQLENGSSVVNITVATNESYQNKQGEQVTDTQWHKVVAWGKTAEYMGKVLKKGNAVVIKGKLKHKSYEDPQGNTRYFSSVVVDEFMVLNKSDRA